MPNFATEATSVVGSTGTSGSHCSVFTPTVLNVASVNDQGPITGNLNASRVGASVYNGPCTYYIYWDLTFGETHTLTGYRMWLDSSGPKDVDLQYWDSGTSAWVDVDGSFTLTDSGAHQYDGTPDTPPTSDKFRVRWADFRSGGSYYSGKFLWEVELYEDEVVPPPPVGPGINLTIDTVALDHAVEKMIRVEL